MQHLLLGPGETITLRRLETDSTNPYGDPTRTYNTLENIQVYAIAPKIADESTEAGQDYSTDSSWDIYAPEDINIKAFDEVTLPTGEITEVIGKPKVWRTSPLMNIINVSGTQFVVVEKK